VAKVWWHVGLLSVVALCCLAACSVADEQERSAQERWLKETPGTEHPGGYLAARFESDGPKGDLRMIPYERPVNVVRQGGYRYVVSVTFTPKVREQFRRIGIADLEEHLRGKNVRVRARVASCWLADGKHPQVRLVVDDLSRFEGVE
jgi:hypothetical protein